MSKKNGLLLCSLLFLLSLFHPVNASVNDEVNIIITNVRNEFCPDRRVGVFDVRAEIRKDTLCLSGEVLSADAKERLWYEMEQYPNLVLLDSIIVLPHPSLAEKTYGVIRLSTAQIRRSPDIDAEIITQATMGAEVRLLHKHSFWYRCQMEDGYIGWVMKSSVAAGDAAFIDEWRQKEKLIMVANWCQIFSKADEKSLPVSDLVRGNIVIFVKKHRKWYEVQLPDGRTGFIKKNYLEKYNAFLTKSQPTPEDLINTATTFLGVPYFWGGTSLKGFDCSGFTQSVFKYNRIKLPRDANMQVHVGEDVPITDNFRHLKPADLLFWGSNDDDITHVGMYLGNLRFIHSDGMVRINSFNPADDDYSEYRHRYLRKARRILK